MASIRERTNADGSVTYQVRWLEGGRGGSWESERFGGDDGTAQAAQFRKLVEAHGTRWPHGWVPGQGFVETPAVPGDVPLVEYATRYIDRLNGVDGRTKDDYRRDVRLHLSLIQHTEPSGLVMPATICNRQRWSAPTSCRPVPAPLADQVRAARSTGDAPVHGTDWQDFSSVWSQVG
ncbi:hypothetical protein JS756_29575 [Streptomyces actuosus]|uniref:Integrase SAM-like N-terminal domain-containing protein n=1 Tax=Streptomyces actuosus TaxID=1885 RepID=A0ABS2VYH1_STRAS|nr:hypothetical protein [Streptomyces actuosus]MBN0048187.1 hypothetical protein [Streptomyces actuosus]